MPRVITAVHYDLKFDLRFTPPSVTVRFTDIDPAGLETHGSFTLTDADATTAMPAGLLAIVNAAVDAKAAAVTEPGSVAARVTAADDAERRLKVAEAQIAALPAKVTP